MNKKIRKILAKKNKSKNHKKNVGSESDASKNSALWTRFDL